jgi:DNA invertase Pin-like site-specific DNA recombinase
MEHNSKVKPETGIIADIYIRSSKTRINDEKISPETQEQECRKYIAAMGWKVGEVRKDPNKSGFTIHYTKRPGLMDLLRRAEEGKSHKVVVYKFSRLGRKYFDEICDKFEDLGVAIVSATEQIDVTTAAGRAFRSNLGSWNRFFAEDTSEWQQDTKQTSAEEGKYNGGHSFYGATWSKDSRRFINDPFKSNIVLKLFEKKAAGYGRNQCMKLLHDNFQEFGADSIILSPTGKEWWQETTLQYLWQNGRYIGLIPHNGLFYGGEHINEPIILNGKKYNNWHDYLVRGHGLSPEEAQKRIIEGSKRPRIIPEPIIPISLWNAVQEELIRNSAQSSSQKASSHEFTGLMFDSRDLQAYQYKKQDDGHPARWLCAIRKRRGVSVCNSKIIDHETFLNSLLEHIFQVAINMEFWAKIKSDLAEQIRQKNKPASLERRRLEKRIIKLQETIKEIEIDRYERRSISAEQFARLNLKYQKELDQLNEQYRQLDAEISIKHSYKDIDKLQFNMMYLREAWDTLEQKERRQAIKSIVKSIMVTDTHVTIDFTFYKLDIYPQIIKRDIMFF